MLDEDRDKSRPISVPWGKVKETLKSAKMRDTAELEANGTSVPVEIAASACAI